MQVGMQVTISRQAIAQIVQHVASDPGCEVCGLLFGTVDRIVAVERTRNVAADPSRAFEIDPAVLIAAHRAAREGGPAVIGCYHSHPNGVGEPSDRDVAAASESMPVWVIVANDVLCGWHWKGDAFQKSEIKQLI
jgi:desampylase